MSLKKEFVALALQPGSNKRELCRRFGISAPTAYKWLKRYELQGIEGLEARSRRPVSSPKQTLPGLESEIVKLRQDQPAWGGRKISRLMSECVAPSTVTNVLRRHGLILPPEKGMQGPAKRFEHAAPNDLWQMDFKGRFAIQQGNCHPLTLLDDHSRFNLAIEACANEQRATVQQKLTEVFRRFGLPARMNLDNGAPWGSPRNPGELSELSIWLIRLGIRISYSRPYHPQTNGKLERFHRSLKAEVLNGRHFRTLPEAQVAFDQWREIYNHHRPHQALGYQMPISRYLPSPWSFPETLPEFEYGPDDVLAKVYHSRFRFKKRYFSIAKGLVGQFVAVRPHPKNEDQFQIYFCHHLMRTIDINQPEYGC